MTSTPPPPPAITSHPAYTILARAHKDPDQASQIFVNKIKNKPLLLTPSHPTTTTTGTGSGSGSGVGAGADKRTLRRHLRRRKKQYFVQHQHPRPLSAKEKRSLRLLDVHEEEEEIRYSTYQSLNVLWKSYILDVLGFSVATTAAAAAATTKQVSPGSQGSLLASADFHGMEVEVARCKDAGRVGLTGIVVRETKGTLLVVTPKDQTRRILKRGAVFRVRVDLPTATTTTTATATATATADGGESGDGHHQKKRQLVFELHGTQLEVRPVDRAVRKFKWHPTDHL